MVCGAWDAKVGASTHDKPMLGTAKRNDLESVFVPVVAHISRRRRSMRADLRIRGSKIIAIRPRYTRRITCLRDSFAG